ncbi:MAG: hypothetical protein O3C28_13160 [Proteobacteria bacterium]|nr:hypothetical protein [Pseudomonadota bacterium]
MPDGAATVAAFEIKFALGPVDLSYKSLLLAQICQSRCGERGFVVPNERAATPSGEFAQATRRAEATLGPSGVIALMQLDTTLALPCLDPNVASVATCTKDQQLWFGVD